VQSNLIVQETRT